MWTGSKKSGTDSAVHARFLFSLIDYKGFLASTAAAIVVKTNIVATAATVIAAATAAEQEQNDNQNPAASTISFKTHNHILLFNIIF